MHEVAAIFGGQRLTGWTSVSIRSSIDEAADSWEVGISTKRGRDAGLVDEQMSAVIEVDGRPLVTGYVTGLQRSTSATSRSLSVAGRSKSGDLIDCSVVGRHTWKSRPPLEIAAELCSPYGIPVVFELAATEPLPSFRAQAGEKVFDALKRLGEELGGRWISSRDGGLRLVRTTGERKAKTVIRRGHNVVTSDISLRSDERFSEYIFRAQLATSDELFGDDAANVGISVTDEGVARYRPLILQADGQGGVKALERQAQWERTTRAGSSVTARYTVIDPVDGFRSWDASPGALWAPGDLVDVDDDLEGASGTWTVRSVTLARSADRVSADLELAHPDSLTIQPPKPRKRGAALW